jgi:protein-L-isoaspartate(D-aspartate) O-methyltransferase
MTDFALARRYMVDGQVRAGGVTDLAVIEAMLAVPREIFLPATLSAIAYLDVQADVGVSRSTPRRLMAPMTVGRLLQAAAIGPGCSALIVGCATGYTAALAAHMGADVTATEVDPMLAAQARANLGRLGFGSATITDAAPLSGNMSRAPFDVILLDGATEQDPIPLYAQMPADGHLIGVFALSRPPQARKVTKSADGLGYRPLFDASAPVLPGLEKVASFQF